ncbi:MAG: peptidoglycan DD-metalloendopeptidase family protein [Synechococcales bacterium]|nr:peptidoglycan DD-metalloendopeptidase family protein [Synechococcales bacterium]
MKRFLKPTGHLLTTAVFTSTALDAAVPLSAYSLAPSPPTPSGDRQSTDAPDLPTSSTAVISPEPTTEREYAQTQIPILPAIQALPSPPTALPPNSSPANLEPTPAIAPPSQIDTAPHFAEDGSQGAIEIPVQLLFEEGASNPETPPSAAAESNSVPAIVADPSAPQESAPTQLVDQNATPDNLPTPTAAQTGEEVESTQDWLDQQLATLVARDRPLREAQFRENLIESARQAIAARDFAKARQLAQNPILSSEEREALLATIEQSVGGQFRPLAPIDAELNLVGVQTRTVEPTSDLARSIARSADRNDWLLSRLSSLQVGDRCIPAAPEPMPPQGGTPAVGIGQQPPTVRSQENRRAIDDSLAAGVGQQPPSLMAYTPPESAAPPPLSWQSQTAASNCETSQPNIGGRTLTTVAGYEWLSRVAYNQQPSSGLRMIVPLPIPAAITSNFGWRTHPIYGDRRFHFGVDFGAPMGTPVIASVAGRVETSDYLDGYGLTVVLENSELGQRTLYAHLSKIAVPPGTWVEQGEVIGWVGSTGNSTGPHLHFEVHQSTAEGWVAVDPMQAATDLLMRWNVADRQP